MLIAVWLYGLASGLLIAEVNVNAMHTLGRPGLGLLTMVEGILGKLGARVAGGAYLFLHYALLVAYMSQGGEILVSAFEKVGGVPHVLQPWIGTVAFTILFGGILYFGQARSVEKLNNAFVAIEIISFVGLILLGITKVNPTQLLSQDWRAISLRSPLCWCTVLSQHHPRRNHSLEGRCSEDSSFYHYRLSHPLGDVLAWNAVILGSVSSDMMQSVSDGSSFLTHCKCYATVRQGRG
jgi:tyrosine-specific transport protein